MSCLKIWCGAGYPCRSSLHCVMHHRYHRDWYGYLLVVATQHCHVMSLLCAYAARVLQGAACSTPEEIESIIADALQRGSHHCFISYSALLPTHFFMPQVWKRQSAQRYHLSMKLSAGSTSPCANSRKWGWTANIKLGQCSRLNIACQDEFSSSIRFTLIAGTR